MIKKQKNGKAQGICISAKRLTKPHGQGIIKYRPCEQERCEGMEGFIDMHCHILPGVDDGAKDIDETRQMLRIAYEEGIRCIIATPHHHPRRGKENPKVLRRQAKLLRDCLLYTAGTEPPG